jgi:hypothetical protein
MTPLAVHCINATPPYPRRLFRLEAAVAILAAVLAFSL